MSKGHQKKRDARDKSRTKTYKQPKQKEKKGTHVKNRAEQRYNLYLSKKDEDLIVAKIMRGDCLYLRNDGENEFHYVKHNNLPVKILYNPEFRMIITPYPFKTDEYNLLEKMEQDKKEALKHPLQDLQDLQKEIEERDNMSIRTYSKNAVNMKSWIAFEGLDTFVIDKVIYLKRSDIFQKNNSLVCKLLAYKSIVKDIDFITLQRSQIPLKFQKSFTGSSVSFMRYDSLQKLLDKNVIKNARAEQLIKQIIKFGSSPMTERDSSIFNLEDTDTDSLDEEDFKAQVWEAPTITFEEAVEKINDPEVLSIQKNIEVLQNISKIMGKEDDIKTLIDRFVADPKSVVLMPRMIETSMIDMLKHNIEVTNHAIKELEEAEEIKFRLETSNEKQLYYLKQIDALTLEGIEREAELQKGYDVVTKMIEEHDMETTFFKALNKDLREDNISKNKQIEVMQEQETELLQQAALDQISIKRLKNDIILIKKTVEELSKDKSTMDKIKAFFN